MFPFNLQKEFEYFKIRLPHRIYVSKVFPFFHRNNSVLSNQKRFVKKVFENESGFEFSEINGEIVLKKALVNKYQVNAVVYTHKDSTKGINQMEFTIQKFFKDSANELSPVEKSEFSFTQKQFYDFLKFLSDVKFIDFSNSENFKVDWCDFKHHPVSFNLIQPEQGKILVDKDLGEILLSISDLKAEERTPILEMLKTKVLKKADLDILSGRKQGLDEFKKSIADYALLEPYWQDFFMNNSWIFGYGLDYKFLGILQKEASLSSTDVDGKNQVKGDFLLASNNFTSIVELKRPSTELFHEKKNRSESWQLSNDLTHAVSQILAQKAEWEFSSQINKKFDSKGNPIEQMTADPKTYLIIGHSEQFQGNTKEDIIKRKTFELYRRNLRSIEIITYDELLERAKFIVNDSPI